MQVKSVNTLNIRHEEIFHKCAYSVIELDRYSCFNSNIIPYYDEAYCMKQQYALTGYSLELSLSPLCEAQEIGLFYQDVL